MRRREFCHLAVTASALALAGAGGTVLAAAQDKWAREFRAALKAKPWLLGWLGVDGGRLHTPALRVEGTFPRELRGTFYRNGPARHEVGGMRYHHWFDGDGMVQAFRIGDGKVSHLGRMVETDKFKAERAAGRALRHAFGTIPPGAPPPRNPDEMNVANIHTLWHGKRLFALWEGGSPIELDPLTLATKGAHSWSPSTKGLPFTAHPRREPDGALWAFGYASAAEKLVLYQIGAGGGLRQAVAVPMRPMPMIHDFVVTERHLVLVMPPFHFERGSGPTFLDSHVWEPERPTRILVVDKADFSKRRMLEMPAQWMFHFGNGWEDGGGVIRFDYARFDDPSNMTRDFREVMRGKTPRPEGGRHSLAEVNLSTGRVREQPLAHSMACEFPRVDPRRMGRRYRKVVLMLRTEQDGPRHPWLNSVGWADLESGTLSHFAYDPQVIAEEHLFLPRPGGREEGDGWIIGTSLDFKAGVTRLSVFEARGLADGPIAVASLPYALPLGFHGTFVPASG